MYEDRKYNALVDSARKHVEIVFGTVIEDQSLEIGEEYYIQTGANAQNERDLLGDLIEDDIDYEEYNYWLEDAVGNYPIGSDSLSELFHILEERKEPVELYMVKQDDKELVFFIYEKALETFEGFKELNYNTELISLSGKEKERGYKYSSVEELLN